MPGDRGFPGLTMTEPGIRPSPTPMSKPGGELSPATRPGFLTPKRVAAAGVLALVAGVVALQVADQLIGRWSAPFCGERLADLPKKKVGLLLGTAPTLATGKVNSYYRTRIDAAVRLFQAGKIEYFLLSGDNSRPEYDEPSAMRRDLIERGVPPGIIYRDYAGFRTLDSVVRAREIFGVGECIFVSQRFHNERAVFLARAIGIDAFGFDAALPSDELPRMKILLREKFSRLMALLDVYLLGTRPKFLGEAVPIGFVPAN